MPAVLNTTGQAFAADNTATLESAAFTPGGTNRVLYVAVASAAGTPVAPTAVKFGGSGGVSLTQIGTTQDLGSFEKASLWRLIAPSNTSGTIHVTWPSNQDERWFTYASIEDCDQTTPNNTLAQAEGTTTAPTAAATSVNGDLVLGFCNWMDSSGGARTVTSGQTADQEIEGANPSNFNGGASAHTTASGTSTTMSWTLSGSVDEWGVFALALNAAAGGGGGGGQARRTIHHLNQMRG